MENNTTYTIQDKEAGNQIETFETLAEAESALKEYEELDKKDGIFKPDFYEIKETEQPLKESTHITWWKGLNEEEQTKLCQKHFQGIPVESLMERSIKVMFHYENPETTTNTVTGGEWEVRGELKDEIYAGYEPKIRIAKMDGASNEQRANANRIVNRVNNFDSLVSALKDAQRELDILKGINKNEQVQEKLTNINQRLVDILTKVNPNW